MNTITTKGPQKEIKIILKNQVQYWLVKSHEKEDHISSSLVSNLKLFIKNFIY